MVSQEHNLVFFSTISIETHSSSVVRSKKKERNHRIWKRAGGKGSIEKVYALRCPPSMAKDVSVFHGTCHHNSCAPKLSNVSCKKE
jgi:Rieske Fe-S protein